MSKCGMLLLAVSSVLLLVACGPTPARVNDSGHELYRNGDYAAALDNYEEARELSPHTGEPRYNAGTARYRLGMYDEALDDYDDTIRVATGDLRLPAFFNRGNAAFQMEQYDQAIEAYKEVLRMNPADLAAKHNLELALNQIPPDAQSEHDQQQEQQQDQAQNNQQEEQEAREESQDQQESDTGEKQEQQTSPQTDQMSEGQARQILESIGEAAQTLQERRQQVFVSPEEPSEFDW